MDNTATLANPFLNAEDQIRKSRKVGMTLMVLTKGSPDFGFGFVNKRNTTQVVLVKCTRGQNRTAETTQEVLSTTPAYKRASLRHYLDLISRAANRYFIGEGLDPIDAAYSIVLDLTVGEDLSYTARYSLESDSVIFWAQSTPEGKKQVCARDVIAEPARLLCLGDLIHLFETKLNSNEFSFLDEHENGKWLECFEIAKRALGTE